MSSAGAALNEQQFQVDLFTFTKKFLTENFFFVLCLTPSAGVSLKSDHFYQIY